MTDEELRETFETLEPDELAKRRMERAVLAARAVERRSLPAAWLALAQETPGTGLVLAAAAAAVVMVATPIGALIALARLLA